MVVRQRDGVDELGETAAAAETLGSSRAAVVVDVAGIVNFNASQVDLFIMIQIPITINEQIIKGICRS